MAQNGSGGSCKKAAQTGDHPTGGGSQSLAGSPHWREQIDRAPSANETTAQSKPGKQVRAARPPHSPYISTLGADPVEVPGSRSTPVLVWASPESVVLGDVLSPGPGSVTSPVEPSTTVSVGGEMVGPHAGSAPANQIATGPVDPNFTPPTIPHRRAHTVFFPAAALGMRVWLSSDRTPSCRRRCCCSIALRTTSRRHRSG